jgi:murein tripeptide amidase MpaA
VLPKLPPLVDWNGKSRGLIAPAEDPWVTPSERTGLTETPRYEETIAWLRRLVAAAPELSLQSLGKSEEGRDIWMVAASRERASTAAELRRSGKPTLLAQAGIHSGEIDGKDAGLMLLRDMTVGGSKRDLLDGANLLFIPILNVDGHERFSAYGRINQRGPVESGWRTNAKNLNLNRDYAKLDTPELRAVVAVINAFEPDLYFDLHVTDGSDYQYDVTFGFTGAHAHSPAISTWLEQHLQPSLMADLAAAGHVPGPLIFSADDNDPAKGLVEWTSSPRFSNGYGDARHLPTLLVENHSLKPYDQRVLGTYVLLESALRALGREGGKLREAITSDRALRPAQVGLSWQPSEPTTFQLLGIASERYASKISGAECIRWLGTRKNESVPYTRANRLADAVDRPEAYWIPPAWSDVAQRLELHGIRIERIEEEREVEVRMDRIVSYELAGRPFEGRVLVSAETRLEDRKETFPSGSYRVSTDQPLGELAILLLEPRSDDSLFQWGFFLPILQQTEYVEAYVMEPLAEAMLAADPKLAEAFARRLKEDEDFAANPSERLQWFYRQTPYYDARHLLYPIGREMP